MKPQINLDKHRLIKVSRRNCWFLMLISLLSPPVLAQSNAIKVVVNSNQDGEVQADESLTLREAIEIVNGTLSLEKLSEAERRQVSMDNVQTSRIEFNLSEREIQLVKVLPSLTSPGLVIDGSTQPGYDTSAMIKPDVTIPIPVVQITSSPNTQVERGLTVLADNITIRDLNIYGFRGSLGRTLGFPSGDVVIGIGNLLSSEVSEKEVPKNILIENNFIGSYPSHKSSIGGQATLPNQSENPSAFGVYVFKGDNVTIRQNQIFGHQGSGIITGAIANNLTVQENLINNNGLAGMPDAIRLEGDVEKAVIANNLIQENAGSAIYAFKPGGAVEIRDNTIINNSQRYERSAIFLMGSNHRVIGNKISNQRGAGVVVAAFPKSDRVIINNNQFSNIAGLAIDLVSQLNTGVLDYAQGDGVNPEIKDTPRRSQAANHGINAPTFATRTFDFDFTTNLVRVTGKAPISSEVAIYRIREENTVQIATTSTDNEGKFSLQVEGLQVGDRLTATATHPDYGTSEMSREALIHSAN